MRSIFSIAARRATLQLLRPTLATIVATLLAIAATSPLAAQPQMKKIPNIGAPVIKSGPVGGTKSDPKFTPVKPGDAMKPVNPDVMNRLTGNGRLMEATTVDDFIEKLTPPFVSIKKTPDGTRDKGRKTRRENKDGRDYTVTEKRYSIRDTPDEIVTYQPVNGFWLGAIVQQDGSKKGLGSMQEVPVVETKRAPYNVTTDIPGSRSVSVNAPSQTSFNNALNSLRTNGNLAGGARTLSVTENYSEQQTAIALGLNASYMGASVAASFSADRYNNNHSISASFIERAFTATADFGGRTRRDAFFKDNFTIDDAKKLVSQGYISSPNNFPAYVKSITYGRVVIFTLTSTLSESEMKAAVSGAYNAGVGSISVNAKTSDKMKNSTFGLRITEFGGSNNNVYKLVQGGSNVLKAMSDYLATPVRLSDMVPISYTLNILRDDKLSAMATTTDYTVTTYTADPIGAKYKLKMWLEITGSDDGVADNTVELYGTVRVDGDVWWDIPREQADFNKREKGQTLEISDDAAHSKKPFEYTVNYAQRTSFHVLVNVRDADGGSADDNVGIFDRSIYLPDYEDKEYTTTFAYIYHGKFDGTSSTLHIRVTKTDDL